MGAALAALDEHGHFELSTTPPASPYPTITAEQAEDVAIGVIRAWYSNPNVVTLPGGSSQVLHAEEQHGAPIEWERVKPAGRSPFIAESDLEPLPPSLGESAVRTYAPRFILPLYVDDLPVVVVSVSIHATNLYIDDRGFVRRLPGVVGGGEWRVAGIPTSLGAVTRPPSPEDAVRFASESTGAKITEVPVLGVPGRNVTSTLARWELRLDREVEFERIVDGLRVRTSRVFVGTYVSFADVRITGLAAPFGPPGLRLFVAAEEQPTSQQIGPEQVPLRPGYAVDLHQVRVLR